MPADLHVHTTASDGSLNPSQVVEIAEQKGLKAIAITDHDTFGGIDEAISQAKKYSLEIIPAVELSSDQNGHDIHIIAYWPDYKAKWLEAILHKFRKGRSTRARVMIQKLKENGVEISFDELKAVAKNGALGRYHVARVMLEKGYVRSIQEAFSKYIGGNSCCYVEKPTKPVKEVLQIIKKAGGVAVLAHPGVNHSEQLISEYSQKGLAGLEVYHPDHSNKQLKHFKEMANQYGLVPTGGSDFHTGSSSRGAQIGSCTVSLDIVDQLRQLAKSTANFACSADRH